MIQTRAEGVREQSTDDPERISVVTGSGLVRAATDLKIQALEDHRLRRELKARQARLNQGIDSGQGFLGVNRLRAYAMSIGYGIAYRQASEFEASYQSRLAEVDKSLTEFFTATPHSVTVDCGDENGGSIWRLDPDCLNLGTERVDSVTGTIEEVSMHYNGSLLIRDAEGEPFKADLTIHDMPPSVAISYEM